MNYRKDYTLWRLLGKNLWMNKKKFFLFFTSTFLSTSSIFILILLRDILQSFQSSVVRLSRGMYGIMIHGMAIIAIVTAVSLMMSLRTYAESRRDDYELLRVLGISVKVQKTLQLMEYVGSMVISSFLGAVAGTGIVYALRFFLRHFFPYFKEILTPSVAAYLSAMGICLLVFILCLLVNNEVAVETNLVSSHKNAFEKSNLPPEFTKWISFLGFIVVAIATFVYLGIRDFGEGMFYMAGFLIGMLILWIFAGGFFFRKKELECIFRPEKMINWNDFYHRYYSKSLKRFLLFMLSFFMLFYYALQMTGCYPLRLDKAEFPYEFVLKTRADDQKAKDLIELIQNKYNAETQTLPALNVVSARGDEFVSDKFGTGNCGQNIGIPESVYKQLTGKTLKLNGESIYIVFQQISSDKAHSIDYATVGKQSLHFGSAYRHAGYFESEELFRLYKVQGSERRILFGYLGKGYNENIIVFSDEYFKQITEQKLQEDLNIKWERHPETDIRLNAQEPEKAENYPDSLVLIKAAHKSVYDIEGVLQDYVQNLPFERKVQCIYDATVNMYYNSNTVIREDTAERTLKLVTCGLQFVFLLFVMLYLVYLNMNEDYEIKKRQFEFFRCLGLPKKQAADAVLFESGFTAFVPLAIGSVASLIYAVGIGNLRRFTGSEWKDYLIIMGGIWCVTYLIYFLVYMFMRKRMERQIIS